MCASIHFRFYYRIIAGRTRRRKFEEFLTEKEIAVFSFQRSSATDFLLRGVKNMKKSKIFALFLSAVLCCCVLGFWSGCSKDYETEAFEDGVKIVKASDSIKNQESLTLPDKIKGKKVLAIGDNVFWQAKIEKVILPKPLLEIGKNAFSYNPNLAEITFNENLKTIGASAFENCCSLGTLTFPDSLERIGRSAFYNCIGLDVQFDGRIKSIESYAFTRCKISYCHLSVEELGDSVFAGSGLRRIHLNTVKKMGDAIFADCSVLQVVEFPQLEAPLGDLLFYNCYQLKPSGIRAPEEALYRLGVLSGYPLMIETHIPEGTETIPEGALAECLLLSDVDIPSSVKSIGKSAFFNCFTLKEIVIPATVETIGSSALANCENLQTVRVEGNPRLEGTLFNHDSHFTLKATVECRKDTFVEAYCKEYSVPYQLIP